MLYFIALVLLPFDNEYATEKHNKYRSRSLLIVIFWTNLLSVMTFFRHFIYQFIVLISLIKVRYRGILTAESVFGLKYWREGENGY